MVESGIDFETRFQDHSKGYPGVADFGMRDKRIIIERDGDYWHGLLTRPDIYAKDREKDRYCQENGWAMLRFWEHEINYNIERCIDIIDDTCTMADTIDPEYLGPRSLKVIDQEWICPIVSPSVETDLPTVMPHVVIEK